MPLKEIIILATAMIIYCIFAISTLFKASSIFSKYQRSFGYISSFIFAYSSIVTVCGIVLLMYLLTQSENSPDFYVLLFYTLISLVISVALFKKARKKCVVCSGIGLFWGMFRIGISAQMYLFFLMICFFLDSFIDSFKSTGTKKGEEFDVTTTYSSTFQGGTEAHTTIKRK